MAITGVPEEKRIETVASALREMKTLAHHLRELIGAPPPRDLLGYIYGQLILSAFHESARRAQ
jgi:hypothetical protein